MLEYQQQKLSTMTKLKCPECLGSLSVEQEEVHCLDCGHPFRVNKGIIDLRHNQSAYYCEFPQKDIARF